MAREINQENAVTAMLAKYGVVSRKDGRCGYPDRLVLLGRKCHVWVEHKTDKGRLTPAQKRVFPKLEEMGDVIVYGKRKTPAEIVQEVFLAVGLTGGVLP